MKHIILFLGLLTSQAYALPSDYMCMVRQYQVDLDLYEDTSTHFWLTDTVYRNTIAHGYAKFIEKKGSKVSFYFYPGNAENVKMTFNVEDVQTKPEKLVGRIETRVGGFLLWDNMNCRRRK